MSNSTAIWEIPDFAHLDNQFFRPHERKQLQNAYETFLLNTKWKPANQETQFDDEENAQMLLQSKIQLFQLFVRTQPVNIRNFSLFHQHQQRIFVERLFYLVLNNVELTHFSTFNVHSIIMISKELEKYQRATNKIILNTGKLNTVIQFVLSFSSSSISSFQLNNLFYLLLNDMNDLSGKIIDRIADLLRVYHTMTYGYPISKQYLIATIDNAISTVNFANPLIYPLYENFLNSSYVYKGPLILTTSKKPLSVSLYTIVQNLSLTLLGLTLDDFECEEKYLSLTSEECYHIRLTIRRLTHLYKHSHCAIEYPLNNLDKQIVIQLINSILFRQRTSQILREYLDLYMKYVRGFSQMKIKRLLHELLLNKAFEWHVIETIYHFLEFNRLNVHENPISNDDIWLNTEQIRLLTHKLYSLKIFHEIFLFIIQEKRTIHDMLLYLDQMIESNEQEQVIDIQEMKTKLTILP